MSRTFEEEHLRYGNVVVSGLFYGEEDHDVECLQWQQQQTKPASSKHTVPSKWRTSGTHIWLHVVCCQRLRVRCWQIQRRDCKQHSRLAGVPGCWSMASSGFLRWCAVHICTYVCLLHFSMGFRVSWGHLILTLLTFYSFLQCQVECWLGQGRGDGGMCLVSLAWVESSFVIETINDMDNSGEWKEGYSTQHTVTILGRKCISYHSSHICPHAI